MADPTTVYCTDQDIAERVKGDFPLLVPKDQLLAKGTDGAITSPNLWVLTSASNNFETAGVAVGHVVQLSKTALYQGTELFGVASVSGSTLTLKRTGISTLAGLPPAFSSQTGITFTITTLAEQIAKASYDLNQQFGIDDMIMGRRAVDMYDPTEVRDVTVFLVAFQQYEQMARSAGEASDHFAAMAKVYQQHYLDRLSRAEVHWKLTAVISESNRFTARIVR